MTRSGVLTAALCGVALTACGGGATGAGTAPAPEGEAGVTAGRVQGTRAHYENVIEMIRGKAPGLEVLEMEGGTIELRIRGMNQSLQPTGQEPLVIVDGVPSSRPAGQALLALNPREVGSIQILKDLASTAVYGTRGANGVILVSLRRRDAPAP